MKRRRTVEATFLERPDAVWRSLAPRRPPEGMRVLRAYAGVILARTGHLRPDEVERLGRIVDGAEYPAPIRAEQAALILRTMERCQ